MESIYDQIHWYRFGQEEKTALTAKFSVLLARERRVKSAWIFGSFTESGGARDIDIAIDTAPELSFKEYLNLNTRLELEARIPVDLVEISKVPPQLKANILKNGTKIK